MIACIIQIVAAVRRARFWTSSISGMQKRPKSIEVIGGNKVSCCSLIFLNMGPLGERVFSSQNPQSRLSADANNWPLGLTV